MAEFILRITQVQRRTGRARTSIYDDIKRGTFPRQLAIGARAVGWLASDIDSWIASRPVAGGVVATTASTKKVAP